MHIPGYSIERTLGIGGMATVFLARQQTLERHVALKTLRLTADDDEDAPRVGRQDLDLDQRFIREGRIVASLRHSHIVPVFDIGATPSTMYFSMEYVPGGSLDARCAEAIGSQEALDLVVKIALALDAAHRKGIVHRDVKPSNILFRDDGAPLLSDFGIAKDLSADLELTSTGRVLGSPHYLSPEQAQSKRVDGRTDLYSLGVILYELLTGERPYPGDTAVQVVLQHLQSPVPKLPERLAGLQPLIDRLMAKDPEHRFPSAVDFISGVRAVSASRRRSVARPPANETSHPTDSRRSLSGGGRRIPIAEEVVSGFRKGILADLAADRLVLPSLPDVVHAVRRELERPNATGSSIARVVGTDPALSAQVLRVANSAFYFGQSPVRDLRAAVVRLGSAGVQQIVMMLVVAQLYDAGARARLKPHLRRLWQHSTLVAALSELIADRVSGLGRDEAMLGGLIHDIGALPVLVWAEPIPSVIGNEATLQALCDGLHAELGQAILERWHYPEELVRVPACHEANDRELGEPPDLVDVVEVANALARTQEGRRRRDEDGAWWDLAGARRIGLVEDDGAALLEGANGAASSLSDALSTKRARARA